MKDVINRMNLAVNNQENNHAGFVGQILVDELKQGNGSLPEAEQMLRDINSRIHLIAIPINAFGGKLRAFHPQDEEDKPYALWVCMNGKEEAENELTKNGISYVDNLVRLHSCGFLTPKNPTM